MGRRAWGKVIYLPWSLNPSAPTFLLKFAPCRGIRLFWPSIVLQHHGFRIISTLYGSLMKGDHHHHLCLEIIKGLVWNGTSKDHLVQPPCSSRFSYSRLHRIMSGWVLSVSRAGDYIASLDYLFQCSVTLIVNTGFWSYSGRMSYVLVCTCCPLSCCWVSLKWVCSYPLDTCS